MVKYNFANFAKLIISFNFEVLCKWDAWCRDRGRYRDVWEPVSRRETRSLETETTTLIYIYIWIRCTQKLFQRKTPTERIIRSGAHHRKTHC